MSKIARHTTDTNPICSVTAGGWHGINSIMLDSDEAGLRRPGVNDGPIVRQF